MGEVLTAVLPCEFGDSSKCFFHLAVPAYGMHTQILHSHSVHRKWKELMSFFSIILSLLMLIFSWWFSESHAGSDSITQELILCFKPASSYVAVNSASHVSLINHMQHGLSSETVHCELSFVLVKKGRCKFSSPPILVLFVVRYYQLLLSL